MHSAWLFIAAHWLLIILGIIAYVFVMFVYGVTGPGANWEGGTGGPSFLRCLFWPFTIWFP